MHDSDTNDDFVESIGETITYFTDLRGMAEPDGMALAAFVMQSIRDRYQGERVTIKRKCPRADLRSRVRAEHNGRNVAELAERYGITRQTVYNYLK